MTVEDNKQNHHRLSPVQEANDDGHAETDTKMIDLNMKPQRVHGQAANNQVQMHFSHLFLHSVQLSTVYIHTLTSFIRSEIPKHVMVSIPKPNCL